MRRSAGAGLDAELVDQAAAALAIDIQRLGLAARSVEGEHQQLPAMLAVRLLGDQRPGRRDQIAGARARQFGPQQLLANALDELLQARGFDLRFGDVVELGEADGRATSSRASRSSSADRAGSWSRSVRACSRLRSSSPASVGVSRQYPSAVVRIASPRCAQAEHVGGDGVSCRRRWFLAPRRGLQREPRDAPACGQREFRRRMLRWRRPPGATSVVPSRISSGPRTQTSTMQSYVAAPPRHGWSVVRLLSLDLPVDFHKGAAPIAAVRARPRGREPGAPPDEVPMPTAEDEQENHAVHRLECRSPLLSDSDSRGGYRWAERRHNCCRGIVGAQRTGARLTATLPADPITDARASDERTPVIRTIELTKIYPGTVRAVDGLNLTVHQGEIFGLLGPNGAGKTTTAACSPRGTIPTHGQAFVGGVDVVAHPAVAKQLIGVVPQTNTLDRALTVWENLYFHGRFFGMGARRVARRGRRDARAVPAHRAGQAPVHGALRRHGATSHGGPGDHARPGGALPRRAHRRPRPAEPHRAVGDPRRAAHGDGQTMLLTTHYMEEADQLCDRIGDHGPRHDPRARHARRAQGRRSGADTIVTVTADGDLDDARGAPAQDVAGVDVRNASQGDACSSACAGTDRRAARASSTVADDGRLHVIATCQVAEPNLETVFINLTGKELRE